MLSVSRPPVPRLIGFDDLADFNCPTMDESFFANSALSDIRATCAMDCLNFSGEQFQDVTSSLLNSPTSISQGSSSGSSLCTRPSSIPNNDLFAALSMPKAGSIPPATAVTTSAGAAGPMGSFQQCSPTVTLTQDLMPRLANMGVGPGFPTTSSLLPGNQSLSSAFALPPMSQSMVPTTGYTGMPPQQSSPPLSGSNLPVSPNSVHGHDQLAARSSLPNPLAGDLSFSTAIPTPASIGPATTVPAAFPSGEPYSPSDALSETSEKSATLSGAEIVANIDRDMLNPRVLDKQQSAYFRKMRSARREVRRLRLQKEAFQHLQTLLPGDTRRMSRLELLRHTTEYIAQLQAKVEKQQRQAK